VAEWEADVIADRTSQALQAKRASGLPICRPSVADDQGLVRGVHPGYARLGMPPEGRENP